MAEVRHERETDYQSMIRLSVTTEKYTRSVTGTLFGGKHPRIVEIKGIKLLNAQNVPEETLVAIAAGVAAYLGHRAKKRQRHFTTNKSWQTVTRRSQLVHDPLHLR